MHLPNVNNAFIDLSKLRDYCLNDDHPIGKYKARVFRSALQIERKDAPKLLAEILRRVRDGEVIEGKHDSYGKRYIVDVNITNLRLHAVVRTV
jgi:hypothetical protein